MTLTSLFLSTISPLLLFREQLQSSVFYYGTSLSPQPTLFESILHSCIPSSFTPETMKKSYWILHAPTPEEGPFTKCIFHLLAQWKVCQMLERENVEKLFLLEYEEVIGFWDDWLDWIIGTYGFTEEWLDQHITIVQIDREE